MGVLVSLKNDAAIIYLLPTCALYAAARVKPRDAIEIMATSTH